MSNNNKKKKKQEIQTITILQDFLLMLFSSSQKILLVLAFGNTDNDANKVERIGHSKFYDQSINDQIKKYEEIQKYCNRTRGELHTGCLLDYQYFKDHYHLIAVDFSKQEELDADSRAIQRIELYGMLEVCTVLEKSKEEMLEFYKGTAKVL